MIVFKNSDKILIALEKEVKFNIIFYYHQLINTNLI